MNVPPPPTEKYDPDFRNLQKPFRMAKLNLLWSKAVHVSNHFLTLDDKTIALINSYTQYIIHTP